MFLMSVGCNGFWNLMLCYASSPNYLPQIAAFHFQYLKT